MPAIKAKSKDYRPRIGVCPNCGHLELSTIKPRGRGWKKRYAVLRDHKCTNCGFEFTSEARDQKEIQQLEEDAGLWRAQMRSQARAAAEQLRHAHEKDDV